MLRRSLGYALLLATGLGAVSCSRHKDESAAAEPSALSASASAAAAPSSMPSWPLGCPQATGTREVRVSWQQVVHTGGCFFFSGPAELGRDTLLGTAARWEENGNAVTLAFGPARFVGDARHSPIGLERTAEHSYNGTWRITETIVGQWSKPSPLTQTLSPGQCPEFHGSYAYQECDEGNPAECPGRCRITAQLTIENLVGN